MSSDAAVVVPSGDRSISVAVTCDARDRDVSGDRGEAVVRHPGLVVGILSPATAADDTTEKLDAYQPIPELTRRRSVRLFERTADRFTTRGALERLCLPNLDERGLSLDDVYRDTTVSSVERIRDTA